MRRLAGILGLVLVASCGPRFSARNVAEDDNTLRWAIPFELTTLDPATASEGRALEVLRQVYEGLVTIDEKGAVRPALAESWETQQGGSVYVFRLRKGVKFTDGRDCSSADVAASFDRACLPATRSPLASTYLADIRGLEEVAAGRSQHLAGVETPDPYTVRIRLKSPRKSFLAKLAYPICAVVPRGMPEIRDAEHMIGTGPFRAMSRSTTELQLEANTGYWGGRPALDRIRIRFVIDPTTRANLFRTGGVDLAPIAGTDVAGIRKEAALASRLQLTPRADMSYLQFNASTVPALRDPRVRRALALCIDRRRIAEEILGGVPKAAGRLIPPGVPGYRDEAAPPAEPEEARRLLREAGFDGGKGFPRIELVFQETQRDNPAAEAIVTAWRKELRIEATTHAVPAAALRELNQAKKIPCFLTAWVGDYPDPDDYVSMLLGSRSDANCSGYSNAEVDRLILAADAQSTEEARTSLYRRAEDLALRDAPIVPLLFLTDAELVSPRLQGMARSAFGHLSFAGTRLAKIPGR